MMMIGIERNEIHSKGRRKADKVEQSHIIISNIFGLINIIVTMRNAYAHTSSYGNHDSSTLKIVDDTLLPWHYLFRASFQTGSCVLDSVCEVHGVLANGIEVRGGHLMMHF